MKTDAETFLMEEWHKALTIMHIAHHKAASAFNRMHLELGIGLIFASAMLGASMGEIVFGKSSEGARLFTLCVGLVSVIFASLQTFMAPLEKSRQHHAAAASFAEVRRALEQLMYVTDPSALGPRLQGVRAKWNDALRGAPNLYSSFHDAVESKVRRGEAG